MPTISAIDLHYSWAATRPKLLSGIHFTIDTHKCYCLQGANGAGKSTLCQLLAGLLTPTQGEILLDSQSLANLSPAIRSQQLLYLRQEPDANLIAATPEEDLAIWQHGFSSDTSVEEDSTRLEALHLFDMEPYRQTPVWKLSVGQKKRISLAALALQPQKFWILDEPNIGIGEQQIAHLHALLQAHRTQQQGYLIVTHDPTLFYDCFDVYWTLENGKLYTESCK